MYSSLCLTVWVAPAVVMKLGHAKSMTVGAAAYACYCAAMIFHSHKALVLAASVVLGAGAAVLWVAQNAFLSACSTPSTIGKHSCVFVGASLFFFFLAALSDVRVPV